MVAGLALEQWGETDRISSFSDLLGKQAVKPYTTPLGKTNLWFLQSSKKEAY